jgi:hypothetical protein
MAGISGRGNAGLNPINAQRFQPGVWGSFDCAEVLKRLNPNECVFCLKSRGAVTSFVFSSCDFVDRSFVQKNKDDPLSHTNQHKPKWIRLELDVTFEAKPTER